MNRHLHRPRVDNTPEDSGRMWPLDLSAIALGGLVLFLIVTQFSADDPRWLYNRKTYLVAVPCVSLALAFILRMLTNRYVQKSIQLGFLFSVCLHLLLLIFAINIVVISAYQPMASKGKKRERSPIRKTVPEHIFQVQRETKETPDWSTPVEAETKSRVIPKEQRQLPPVHRSQARMELPKPRQPEKLPMQKYLMERQEASEAMPTPADSPGKLARRQSRSEPITPATESIDLPASSGSVQSPVQASPTERTAEDNSPPRKSNPSSSGLKMASAPPAPSPTPAASPMTPAAAAMSPTPAMPTIGDAGLARARRSRSISKPAAIAGSAPAPVTVAVAQESADAAMMLNPTELPTTRLGETTGAQLSQGPAPSFMAEQRLPEPTGGAQLSRNAIMAAAGSPHVSAGSAPQAPGRSRRMNVASGLSPVGSINPSASIPSASDGATGSSGPRTLDDRLTEADIEIDGDRSGGRTGRSPSELTPAAGPAMALDLLADIGPVGIADQPAERAGLMPGEMKPEISAMELPRKARPRRRVGGPATPAGTKIAAVESFSRRVMRTSGGAASSAPGMGGPATEEAIERGLAYLASIQNDDGSWSLQGHGEAVLLRSDTAATGLCLLAFQGAGYTHTQHQYASTVSSGLKFLLDNQRSSGNLYRSENPTSDRNVMFYSHGIASLALCEAYGMTQDRELRQGAQDALNYIIETQHRQRGGWRYSPQVSSDTSVTGWMMMALKSGELSGLIVPQETYDGIDHWLSLARDSSDRLDRYRYNPFAPDTPEQRHGRMPTPTMTAVGMLMRMYNGWSREVPAMQSAADYLLTHPPRLGERRRPERDGYYWYYATQFMFHMGGDYWDRWNQFLNPLLLETQIKVGPEAGSWDPELPVRDRWAVHAGRVYVTTMNLLNLEVYYRHLPIYEDTASDR
ncbi:prenyltransferase/squalene oxidase repeat-containing protein [Roseiconus lacunae]|uniref:Prenyltransferase/squalene oxidase repeat-containing protein n=1 Tax=Roseiconus lacunae TaxID=2605694 RepID=A0ABT7PIJ1_9BACT|nr:prenyltransferase/squalene oxidase repeat-containing protein [Roseiconus lacunae]MDM4016317.1 prenyltransferase/squalene oxidase repeat-containing protein [Roseiconus lacunae]